MPVDDPTLQRNRLLAALPPGAREPIRQRAEVRQFGFKESVYEPGEPIEEALFPVDAVFSLLSVVDSSTIEVATVGREGFVGLPLFLEAAFTGAHRAIAQIPGRSVVLTPGTFAEVVASSEALHAVLHRYVQALITQIAQSAACNRAHKLDQRCSRWLLMTHDRVQRDEFELTQELLGRMLGVGRPRVNAAARRLQDAGLITYLRGRITILDRRRLEERSCECYGLVRAEFERLLEPPSE